MSEPGLPLKVFVSYAHEDELHRVELAKHLRSLEAEGLIQLWHDRKITAGREWAGAIDASLGQAHIVLLLISADFLASDYCNDVELTEATRRHESGRARVVPIILRSCDWRHSRFARFNALPADGTAVVEATHPDQLFAQVATGLRAVVEEMSAAAPSAPGAPSTHTPPRAPVRRTLRIAEIGVFGVKLGPFEMPLPAVNLRWVVPGLVAAVAAGAWAVYAASVAPAVEEARAALRIGHYERALEQAQRAPAWAASWPALRLVREKAALGLGLYKVPQDWQSLGLELKRQIAAHPKDPDLLVIEAQMRMRRDEDYADARQQAGEAGRIDPGHADAAFLLGLLADIDGKLDEAAAHYERAATLGPDSPQYLSNWGRALLDLGRPEESLSRFARVAQFPLARLEQALALWALGRPGEAAAVQQQATTMLDDSTLMASFFNRRAWVFFTADRGIRLSALADKRCYALMGRAASLALTGGVVDPAALVPPACDQAELRALVADDLCRHAAAPQPRQAVTAERLRLALGFDASCPAPRHTPGRTGT